MHQHFVIWVLLNHFSPKHTVLGLFRLAISSGHTRTQYSVHGHVHYTMREMLV